MSVRPSFLGASGNDPIAVEVSGNTVNAATRHVDISDISGEGVWATKIDPKNVLSLLAPASTDGGYAALLCCANT